MSLQINKSRSSITQGNLSVVPVLFSLLILMMPNASYSQSSQGDITVVVIDESGSMGSSQADDFQTGLEELAAEYGSFSVSSYDEVRGSLSSIYQRALDVCRGAPDCLQDILQNTSLVGVIVARVEENRNEYLIELSLLSLMSSGPQDTDAATHLNESSTSNLDNQMFLLVPIFELLEALENSTATRADRPSNRGNPDRPEEDNTVTYPDYPSYDDLQTQESSEPPQHEERRASREAATDESTEWLYPDPVISQSAGSADRNILASSLTISGAVLAASGLTLWSWADNIQAEIQSTPHERDKLMALQDQGSAVLTAGNVFFISGLTALLTGVVFHLTDIGMGTEDTDNSFDNWSGLSIQPMRGGSALQFQVDY